MSKTENLYLLAAEHGIPVDDHCPDSIISMSVKLPNGVKVIGLSPDKTYLSEESPPYTKLECFAHEMGHCMTESFYSVWSPLETRAKHEARAHKWAANYVIPFSELRSAVSAGNRELWQLAEYFDVSPAFVEKAIQIHEQHGNVVPKEFYAND